MNNQNPAQLRKTARTAGVLTLIITLIAPFSMLVVPSTLVVPGDASATAGNLQASEGLFRAAIAGDTIVFLIEIALVVVLYMLLKPVNQTLSLIAAFARLAMTVVQGINIANYLLPLLMISGTGYLSVFSADQLNALILLFLNAHESTALIWGLFFSLHLAVSGYLVVKAEYFPGYLGYILMGVSLIYLTQSLGTILVPASAELFASIGLAATIELVFPLYLVIKGTKSSGQAA